MSEAYLERLEEKLVDAREQHMALQNKIAALVASLSAIESPGDMPKKDLTYTEAFTQGLLLGQHELAKSVLKFLSTGGSDEPR